MTTTAAEQIEVPDVQAVTLQLERPSTFNRAARRGWEWLLTAPSRLRMPMIGRRVRLAPPLWTYGERSIRIGDGSAIWHHSRIIALNSADGEIRIDIGPNSAIHPYAHIAAIRSVKIGEGAMFASGAYVSDHDHDWRDPNDPMISNSRVLASPVVIGPHVWLGERVCVLSGVTIGGGSTIGAGSVVTRSLPPRCVAVGAPARVIRLWDDAGRRWVAP